MSAITPNFAGEMQLAGWSESHTGGCKVTFWLQGPDDLAPFRALTVRKGNQAGHRFMAALVEVGDDEMPVQPAPVAEVGIPITEKPKATQQDKSIEPIATKPKGGVLSKLAGMWCNDPEFHNWINGTTHNGVFWQCNGPNEAALFVCEICDISSRAELDNDEYAASIFHSQIRGPYSKHLIARGIVA